MALALEFFLLAAQPPRATILGRCGRGWRRWLPIFERTPELLHRGVLLGPRRALAGRSHHPSVKSLQGAPVLGTHCTTKSSTASSTCQRLRRPLNDAAARSSLPRRAARPLNPHAQSRALYLIRAVRYWYGGARADCGWTRGHTSTHGTEVKFYFSDGCFFDEEIHVTRCGLRGFRSKHHHQSNN